MLTKILAYVFVCLFSCCGALFGLVMASRLCDLSLQADYYAKRDTPLAIPYPANTLLPISWEIILCGALGVCLAWLLFRWMERL
jgi:hypothetical protein